MCNSNCLRQIAAEIEEPDEPPLGSLWSTAVPLFLIFGTSSAVLCAVNFAITHCSSPSLAFNAGFLRFFCDAWTKRGFGTLDSWQFLIVFMIYSSLSIEALGGSRYQGPPTSTGFTPVYWHSGFTYYVLTMEFAGYFLLGKNLRCYSIYEGLPGCTMVLVIMALIVAVALYAKGILEPSAGDHGRTGNIVYDFFWGIELFPRIGDRFDVKKWVMSRFGMMLWQLLVLASWKAQVDVYGWNWAMAATASLQTVYIAKFFWWEDGYMQTTGISIDKAGFFLCWSGIAFLGPMYSLTSFYMVDHSPSISVESAAVIVTLGLLMISLTYWCDYQKRLAREKQNKCTIWGSPPVLIKATYEDASGESRTNVLLASGFWSICRHPHYVFEILTGLFWALPSGGQSVVPYLYVIFLVGLLTYRTCRLEDVCAKKYGKHWEEYCSLVKYKIIPYIY
ncbi:hypothetical protein V5799_021730 [Amblyomma americanum]|uniref:7-dehydrocholesterol reductase n=1 Tax=Amblyomma americanum TaxID=6943 RepID=A0AAQ4FP38_AMBAM